VIPCYNAARFVGDAITSILDQSWPRVEVVVVDDGSSDTSAEVIGGFGDRVKRIRLDANRGGSFARNRGAELSTGELLLFLDADDLLRSDTLEGMVKASRAHPDALIACRFSYLVADNDGWKQVSARPRLYAGGDQLLAWLEGNWSPPCCILWPRHVLLRVGGWNESLTRNDDGDLVMRALSKNTRIVSANGGEAFYRRHGRTRLSVSTTRNSESHLRSAFDVLIDLSTELESQKRLAQYSDAISEDFAEIALLSFRAGFPRLGAAGADAARQLRSSSHAAPRGFGHNEIMQTRVSRMGDRVYAAAIRGRAQARRWMKRRSS
jgi:Glycosyltransferases, probably involved in cell wall biogenesis